MSADPDVSTVASVPARRSTSAPAPALSHDREGRERMPGLGALSDVVGRFAHDFSNLLATIVLNLNLIEKKCSDPTMAWFASSALRVADRGVNLTQRLLAFAGRQQLSCAPTDLDRLVSEMRSRLFGIVGPDVALELSAPGELWRASVDADQLAFAIENLAENARDAMPRGGRMTIEIANARIATGMYDLVPGDYVVVALEDTGDGPSDEVVERAFEPFFSTRRSQEHPGLGLSVVLGIARAHGGSARLMRAAAGGCRVEIYLPRTSEVAACASRDTETAPGQAPRLAKTTVLVVDDDPDLRSVAQEGLKGLGCDVLLADGGERALDILASPAPVDLLMVDIAMAGMNGLELIRRARAVRPGLRVLVMTGSDEFPGPRECEPAPPVLRKPFRIDDLAQGIAAALTGGKTPTQ
jgi:CheY-like chemotaxis protein